MDYNSISEIFAAGINNMTVLRNNKKQDDGTDTIDGVDWFQFNGQAVNTIYVSGNSWLGFGSSSEHLKVNSRDGAMYSLYREEGTLYNHYHFLKIRWSGYTYYGSTSTSYKLEYDVILWDTGDISLHIITWPTTYNTGTYSLTASSTYTYTVSASSTEITFKKSNSGFEVQNSIINLTLPYIKKYLLRDGNIIYTITNNKLLTLGEQALTADLFLNSGFETVSNLMLASNLNNPELLYWHEIQDTISQFIINGAPLLPQVVLYEAFSIEADQLNNILINASDDALFSIAINENNIWQYHNGTNWVVANQLLDGMTKNTVHALTEDIWNALISSNAIIKFRCVLPTVNSFAGSIGINNISVS